MNMRLSSLITISVILSIHLSCSKQDVVEPVADPKANGATSGNSNNGNAVSPNDIPETKPAIQKSVTFNVASNIGGYMEALPARYDSTTKTYPLLIFIHGVGELGDGAGNLWSVANIGTPRLIKNGNFPVSFISNGSKYSFIVLAPQFRQWPSAADVEAMITYATSKYRVDPKRIYLSGLSMGGGAVWEHAAVYNTRIAAIAPICGASWPTDQKAQKIAQGNIAVWAFHNQDDGIVTASNSTGYVNKINAFNPAIAARISLWPSGGHDAWTKATDPNYRENGMNMYEWLLQYHR